MSYQRADMLAPGVVVDGEKIRAARLARGWTQAQLAERIVVEGKGKSRNYVEIIESANPRYRPSLPALKVLCRKLGLDLDDVLIDIQAQLAAEASE